MSFSFDYFIILFLINMLCCAADDALVWYHRVLPQGYISLAELSMFTSESRSSNIKLTGNGSNNAVYQPKVTVYQI